jgi:predicted acyl esterase
MEMTGHGIADLWIESSEPDAALFLYLSEVEADGSIRYVTEGLLRALHRKESPAPERYRTTWPFRSFHRSDAAPLVPGQAERIRIPLLPTSWVFRTGSRIRLSIAGADADHCAQVPHGRPPRLTLLRGGDRASALELPMRALALG